MKKIFAAQVEIGMHLSCDIYNDKGVLLWSAGSAIETEQQAEKLIKEGYRSDLQEWVPMNTGSLATGENEVVRKVAPLKKVYVYNTVLDALLEIQLPVNHIFDVFKVDAFHKDKRNLVGQIKAVVDVIIDVTERHPEESFATISMYTQGKYTIMHAIAKSVMSCLICEMLSLSEAKKHSVASAALTANGSNTKLMEILCVQKNAMTEEQTEKYQNHPFEVLTLLTRAGIRDEEWLDSVLMHHEYLDGSGFPRGLKDKEITKAAKVISVADVYVTMILPKKAMQLAMDPPSALKRLYKKNSKRLDIGIVGDIVKKFGIIPPGTFVKLKDGKVGIVICSTDDPSKPVIMKIGESLSKFFAEFSLPGQFKIVAIIQMPGNLPKRVFKIWKIYAEGKS